MELKEKMKVHFMGIGGSGMSAVALLAHHAGYEVSGCDLQESTPYIDKCKKLGIKIYHEHDKSHLENVDILATTAATHFQKQIQPEISEAKKNGKLMQWQEFLGRYLHKDKTVVSICGTNGKSTTTALASLVLEEGGLDPSVMIGATVKKWGTNYRTGKSQYFVTESDEFFNNFLAYHPDIIILNNIEFDHPDFFRSLDQIIASFEKFIKNIKGDKVVIFNQDDPGIKSLFEKLGQKYLQKLKLIGYTLESHPLIPTPNSTKADIKEQDASGTTFTATNPVLKIKSNFKLDLPGNFNVSNALGIINLASILEIENKVTNQIFSNFEGIGRRLDKIGETKDQNIVYDDYGHHPSAIKVTLDALRQRHPENRITAVVEPHSYSRTKQLLHLYKDAFSEADEVIIAPIFMARDTETFGISEKDIVAVANHTHIQSLPDFDSVVDYLTTKVKSNEIIIVFGAGKSYLLTRQIFTSLSTR